MRLKHLSELHGCGLFKTTHQCLMIFGFAYVQAFVLLALLFYKKWQETKESLLWYMAMSHIFSNIFLSQL